MNNTEWDIPVCIELCVFICLYVYLHWKNQQRAIEEETRNDKWNLAEYEAQTITKFKSECVCVWKKDRRKKKNCNGQRKCL